MGRSSVRSVSDILRITVEQSGSLLQFIEEPYSFDVTEGATVGSVVYRGLRVRAENLRGQIRYLATGVIPATTLFAVDSATG